jgi:hypothetical protein
VMVAVGNRLDGLYFNTWSRLSRHRVLYMTVYIHVPKVKRTNLEPSGKKDTFLGYKVFHVEIDCEEKKALMMTI